MGYSKFLCSTLRSMLLISITLFFFGCAVKGTGPMFSLEEPKADVTIVFHYRVPSFIGSAMQYDILSNGTPLTRIGNGGYFKEIVNPGQTIYETRMTTRGGPLIIQRAAANARAKFIQAYSFTAEVGKLYFFRWTPDLSANTPPVIEQIPKEEALQQLKGLRSFLPAQLNEES